MINEHFEVVCDVTKILLNDWKTLYPGYVEVKFGQLFQHYSDDPRNKIYPGMKGYTVGMLKNRVEFHRIEKRGTSPLKKHMHFVDMKMYKRVIERMKGGEKK